MVAGPCTLIPAGRKTTASQRCAVCPPGDEPHLHLAIFKAARLLLASAFCKPTEQSFSLALPWFNLGILLGSSLTLTLAGTACTSLKGKAGSEQSCGCRTQPGNCFSFLSLHYTREARERQNRSRFPGQRGLSISVVLMPKLDSRSCDTRAAATGSTNPGLLEAHRQLRRGPRAGAALHRGIQCCWAGSACRAAPRRPNRRP